MPAEIPAAPPHAYVVEYRALDRCAPPACSIKPASVVGWSSAKQPDGSVGGYEKFGETNTELFFRRAAQLPKDQDFSFDLPPREGLSDLEMYLAAHDSGEWIATIEVLDGANVIDRRPLRGTSKAPVMPEKTAGMANQEQYFTHVRFALPSRSGRPLTVRIRNAGEGQLAVGAPNVLARVEGRAARQAYFLIFDAVSYPLQSQMLSGSNDKDTAWLGQTIAERGAFFPQGLSPGLNTATFTRRFFRTGFFKTDGEPGLNGQGIDEDAPSTVPTFVARLAEQGFQTEAIVGNFLLMPSLTRTGFDGGYLSEVQTDDQMHPEAIARRLAAWAKAHPDDDAFVMLWFTTTHETFPKGRTGGPYDLAPFHINLSGDKVAKTLLDQIWANLLTSVDTFKTMREQVAALAPSADRMWFVGTDHGRVFTQNELKRPFRLPPGTMFPNGCSHCCLAAGEEAHAPFAVFFENGAPFAPRRSEEPTSEIVAWRFLEDRFGVSVGLPDTTTYDSAALDSNRVRARWEDGFVPTVGDTGSIRATRGSIAYRSLNPRLTAAPLWGLTREQQLLLTGSPLQTPSFLAEELYDLTTDPFERKNIAAERPELLLAMRRRTADWLAGASDLPSHPRYRYALRFPAEQTLSFEGPSTFSIAVDGKPPLASEGRKLTARGTLFEIIEEEPSALLSVSGGPLPSLLRCAASGLPLQQITAGQERLNLAVARTNCVEVSDKIRAVAAGEILFSATRIKMKSAGVSGTGASSELVEGLRRWGYVRDTEKKDK